MTYLKLHEECVLKINRLRHNEFGAIVITASYNPEDVSFVLSPNGLRLLTSLAHTKKRIPATLTRYAENNEIDERLQLSVCVIEASKNIEILAWPKLIEEIKEC